MKLQSQFTTDSYTVLALAHFDRLRLELASNNQINHAERMSVVAHARLMSSNSLRRQEETGLERWNLAQQLAFTSMDQLGSWDLIKKINSILTGNEIEVCERNSDIFAGGVAFIDNERKNEMLEIFKHQLLPSLGDLHPIIASTMLRYWIVSLHAFCDGNGRTAQTIADAWLLKYDYLPLVFINPYQGQFAAMPEIRDEFTFEDALESSFAGLANAFKLYTP